LSAFETCNTIHYFSFEAVILCLARWDLIRQWQELHSDRGRAIFDKRVTEVPGEYANIFS
jgi:hypothetical protein